MPAIVRSAPSWRATPARTSHGPQDPVDLAVRVGTNQPSMGSVGHTKCKIARILGSGDLDDALDLYRGAERELTDPDGAAGVLARIAEDLAEELTRPVDHGRLSVEAVRRRDEADHLHDPHHAVDADQGIDGRDGVERA